MFKPVFGALAVQTTGAFEVAVVWVFRTGTWL
jgi:hypothetical protein